LTVLVRALGLGDGLVTGCDCEEGVGDDALPYEFVLSEPAVVLVHATVVGAGGGGAGLAVTFSLGGRCAPEDSPEPPQQPYHCYGLLRAVLSTTTPGFSLRSFQGSLCRFLNLSLDDCLAIGAFFSDRPDSPMLLCSWETKNKKVGEKSRKTMTKY